MEANDSLLARLRQRLAEDPRTNLLDPELEMLEGGILRVGGEVDSDASMAAVEQVVVELLPAGTKILNRLCIVTYTTPGDTESLA
jgi:hypothetical protein